ncbi:MAG TPA: TolC family outer membrane protein [Hyphomicrobiaceae bacterium]|nr:TolC family outer membrane protein [Hyphomicrobiaceae bacterium]
MGGPRQHGQDRFRHTIRAIAAMIFAGFASIAGHAQAQTLPEVLQATGRSNPRLEADRARQRATEEEIARAKSGFWPSVNASAEIGYRREETSPATAGRVETNPKGVSITATQPVFSGFRTVNAVRRAEAVVRAGKQALRITEQDVLLEAASAYADVVRDQAIVRLRESNVAILTRDLEATRARFQAREVTRTDVAQAEARRVMSLSDLEAARAALRSSRASFERVVGTPPGKLSNPKPPVADIPATLPRAVEIARREHPRVLQAAQNEEAARLAVDIIRGELLPTVSIEARYQKNSDPSPLLEDAESATVMGRVTVPIYPDGGEVYARIRQAKHTHLQSLQLVSQERADAEARIVSVWSSYSAARDQLKADRAHVAAARVALSGVRQEERVGQRTLLDVLNAESEVLTAGIRLLTRQREEVVTGYTLLAAIGRLRAPEGEPASSAPSKAQANLRQWSNIRISRPDSRDAKGAGRVAPKP